MKTATCIKDILTEYGYGTDELLSQLISKDISPFACLDISENNFEGDTFHVSVEENIKLSTYRSEVSIKDIQTFLKNSSSTIKIVINKHDLVKNFFPKNPISKGTTIDIEVSPEDLFILDSQKSLLNKNIKISRDLKVYTIGEFHFTLKPAEIDIIKALLSRSNEDETTQKELGELACAIGKKVIIFKIKNYFQQSLQKDNIDIRSILFDSYSTYNISLRPEIYNHAKSSQ